MPELIKKMNHWNSLRGKEEHTANHIFNEPINHSFQTVVGNVDNPYIFGGGIFDQALEEIISLMPANTDLQQSSREQMQGIALALKGSQRSLDQILRLKQYLDSLDQRRNTNWRTLFAWLDESFE
jgi:hypothetical protein